MTLVRAVTEDLDDAPNAIDAFAAWVEPHLPSMSRLAGRLAPWADRDDVAQEALVQAWRKRHHFDPRRGSPSAWLLAITADRARRARRRPPSLALVGDIAAEVKPSDDTMDVEHAVSKLSTRQRLAVDCFCFCGLSVAETSAVMNCSEGTVKSTLSDARQRLRGMLEVIE